MNYNLILQRYYYLQTGEWTTCDGTDNDMWRLAQSVDGTSYISRWNCPFEAPSLTDTNIFNQTNEDLATVLENQLWQDSKNLVWKMIENAYVDFLATDWTNALRGYGIITPTYTITVSNTDAATNMYMLLVVRGINKDVYAAMSNEFTKFKYIIEEMGGEMSKVEYHDLDNSSSSSESSETP